MRTLSYIFIIPAVLFSIFTVGRILLTFSLFDYAQGYYPAVMDLLSGRGLYDNPAIDNNYPPSAFLYILPIGLVNPDLGQKIWTLLSWGSLILSIILVLKSLNRLTCYTFLLIYSFAMLSFPVKFTLGLGQINLFILLLIAAGYYFYSKHRPVAAGICIGVATAIKVFPLVLLLFFARKKQWSAVFASLAVAGGSAVIITTLFGWHLFTQYIFEVVPTLPTVGNASYYNQALTGFLARLNTTGSVFGYINYAIFIFLLIGSFLSTSKHGSDNNIFEFSLYLLATLIGAGLSWQHHFVLLLIPLTSLVLVSRQRALYPFFFIVYLLVSVNIKYPQVFDGIRSIALSHVLYGTCLLWILLRFHLSKPESLSGKN